MAVEISDDHVVTIHKSEAKKKPYIPRDITSLLKVAREHPVPEEVLEKARAVKESALIGMGNKASAMTAVIYRKCYHQLPTTSQKTLAVAALADYTAVLLWNPYFVLSLGVEGTKFALFHEARHLIHNHLLTFVVSPEIANDPTFTIAVEAGINREAMIRLNADLPSTTEIGEDGEPVRDADGNVIVHPPSIVDPEQIYSSYVRDLNEQGLEPVSEAAFYRTDMDCYRELKRMATPPSTENACGRTDQDCPQHGTGDSGGTTGESSDAEAEEETTSGGQDGKPNESDDESDAAGESTGDTGGNPSQCTCPVPENVDTRDAMAKEAIGRTIQDAIAGNSPQRDEILYIAGKTEDLDPELSKMWGDMGLGRVRGETLATRKVDWWQQWVQDMIASRTVDGDRLVYSKKRGAVDLFLGRDPLLGRRGMEEEHHVVVAIDTSGSMPDRVIDWLTQLVGYTDGIYFEWLAFDAVVEPFEAGEAVVGGGGTSFAAVMDYVEGRSEVDGRRQEVAPDAVLMLTDGGAPSIRPEEPDKWVWLITENGDTSWLETHPDGMDFHRVTTHDGLVSAR